MSGAHATRKAAGLCTGCGEARDNNTQKCSSCRESRKSSDKARLQRLKESATCSRCLAPTNGTTRCEDCTKKQARYDSIRNGTEAGREYNRSWQRHKRLTDPQHKLKSNLRTRLWQALKGKMKTGSAIDNLGCSVPDLKTHLEDQFTEGMTWDNHGQWHIDHILPLDSFDLQDREQFLEACHYSNLQPLWAADNLAKGNKIL